MKHSISLFCLFICTFFAGAQGTITSFSMSPVNPMSTDTIYIYAGLQFTSGDCELDNLSYSLSGNNLQANTHHCVGALAVICPTTDTFKINPLPAGNYNFNLFLTTGISPAPCVAGIAPDHDSTFSFTVGPVTAGVAKPSALAFNIYPNPVTDQIRLEFVPSNTAYKIINVTGQVVKSGVVNNNIITHLEVLPKGLYFLKIRTDDGELVRQMIKA